MALRLIMPRVLFSGSSSYAKASFLKFRFHAYLCLLLIYKSPTQSHLACAFYTLCSSNFTRSAVVSVSWNIFNSCDLPHFFIYSSQPADIINSSHLFAS